MENNKDPFGENAKSKVSSKLIVIATILNILMLATNLVITRISRFPSVLPLPFTSGGNISGKSLSLVDKQNRVALYMSTDENDLPIIALYNKANKNSMKICIAENQNPRIIFFNESGSSTLTIGQRPNASPDITFYDDKGQRRLQLSVNQIGSPGVAVFDEDGDFCSSFGIDKTMSNNMYFYNKFSGKKYEVGINRHGKPIIDFKP